MHHDIKKVFSYHNFYLFFPICKRKEFKIFQLLESFKVHLLRSPCPILHKKQLLSSAVHFLLPTLKIKTNSEFLDNIGLKVSGWIGHYINFQVWKPYKYSLLVQSCPKKQQCCSHLSYFKIKTNSGCRFLDKF